MKTNTSTTNTKEKLTKADVVDSIVQATSLPPADVQAVVDSFLGTLKTAIGQGQRVEFRGFGSFELRLRKEKKRARNPRTGEIVCVPEHKVVAFRAGQELKERAWNQT